MNKQLTLKPKMWKMGRRVLACFMALLLALTGVVTIPEFGMTAKAAGTISYGVTITGGTGALVTEELTKPSPLDYQTTISPYNGTKLIHLKNDTLDDSLRLKQWNVTVTYLRIVSGEERPYCSYTDVITDSFFRGVDTTKLSLDDWQKVTNALNKGLTVYGVISIAAETENKYATVSFDGNGADAGSMEGVSVEKDKSYTLPASGFTKDAYQLAGWQLDASHVYQPGNSVIITQDTTFTALWEKMPTVSFDGNGAEYGTMAPVPVEKDTAYTLPTCKYSLNKYAFGGWKLGEVIKQPGDEIIVSQDTTLCAVWEPLITAFFDNIDFRTYVSENVDSDGNGSLSEAEIAAVTEINLSGLNVWNTRGIELFTELVSLDVSHTHLGHDFGSMDLSQNTKLEKLDCSYCEFTGKQVNEKIAACPSLKWLDISGYNNQGNIFSTETYPNLEYLKASACSLVSLDVSGSEKLTTLICDNNTTLDALDVTHNPQLTSLNVLNTNIDYLDISQCPALLTGGSGTLQVPDGVRIFEETPVSYVVTLSMSPDGIAYVTGGGTYWAGDEAHIWTCPADEGAYVFRNWTEDGVVVSEIASVTFAVNKNRTLVANYEKLYTITPDANGGSGTMSDAKTVAGEYTLPACDFSAPEHKEFDGWLCKVGITMVGVHQPGETINVTEHTILYAQWKPEICRITTTHGFGGNTDGSDEFAAYGSEATVRATPIEHYHFVHWEDADHGYAVVSTEPVYTFTVNDWVELKAIFEIDSYTISYNANGGGGSMASVSVDYNRSYKLLECGFTAPDGKEFAWWDCDGTKRKPGDYIYSVSAPVTVTAVWVDAIEPIAITEANFPDEKFRDELANYYDENGDGFFAATEIAEITDMNLFRRGIKDLTGISYFTELKVLQCSDNYELTTLDVSALEKLEYLSCRDGAFTQLDLTANKNLKYLYADECHSLTSLKLSGCTELEEVDLTTSDALTSLDLSDNMKIKVLKLRYVKMTSIDLTGHDKLEELDCFCCTKATSLVLTGCTALKKLNVDCMYELTQLDLTGLSALEELDAGTLNAMTSMTISGVSSLKKLDLGGSRVLESLTLSNLPNLEELDFSETKLTSVDISGLPKLKKLAITSNEQLTSINFGSLATQLEFLDCSYDKALSLNFASFTNLETLFCTGCNLERLDVHKLTKLKNLTCRSNKLTQINIDGLADLAFVDCRYNPNLTSLDISSSPALVAEPDRLVYRDAGVVLHLTPRLNVTFVHSCSFQNKIELNYKFDYDLSTYDEYWLSLERQVFSGAGSAFTWKSVELRNAYIDDSGRYVFTYDDIAAAEMGDQIKATLCARMGDVICESDVDTYSVKDYCKGRLENSTNPKFRR
ncbi:MAG: InlB B-repeat-containing protein, partial [Lachnospiraceae bacterium]|nr:InlB B-repeat-containing protein [Lachnospiraceae bacterium]